MIRDSLKRIATALSRSLRIDVVALVALLPVLPAAAPAAGDKVLWQIGKPDHDNAEFALAPNGYKHFKNDGWFVVGQSSSARDWPYVHPGPADKWAGGHAHAFTVLFGIKDGPGAGVCRLEVDLLDTHSKVPPALRIHVNGTSFERTLPAGAGDRTIRGQVAGGKANKVNVEFPASLLKSGDNRIAFITTSGSWMLYDCVELQVPAGLQSAPVSEAVATTPVKAAPAASVREIIVVFKTHFDIGFTDMASNIVQRYRTSMIDKALEVADQNRDLPSAQQFVWTIPGWPAHKIMEDWPGQTPERKQRLQQAFKEGRFVVHALPFTTHTELLEPEDLVRGLGYSSRLTRELGLPLPLDAKMTDVPEHTWMLATLLRHAGVKFMVIGCNGRSGVLRVPWLFWWEGPDGSRVLTMYSPKYGTELMPPADWPYHTWLAMLHTGDNHGPPRPDEVKKVLDQAAKDLPGIKIRIGRMSDFADAILADKPNLPVVRGDAPDSWIHGPMSDPAGARIARNTRPLIPLTEALNTQLRAWGIAVPDAEPAVAAAYEQSLLYGEHTWGGSVSWIGRKLSYGEDFKQDRAQGKFQRSEGSWDEHTGYIQQARDLIAPALQKNLSALAQAVNTSGRRIVVYNPLPWKRDGLVTLPKTGAAPAALKPADGIGVCPLETYHEQIRFVAREVPPMGYRTYVPAEAGQDTTRKVPGASSLQHSATAIDSPCFRLTLDPSDGTVRSLVDKHTGRELVDATSPVGLGQYLYERFDSNQVWSYCASYLRGGDYTPANFGKPGMPTAVQCAYQALSPRNFNLRFEQTPMSVSAVMEAQGSGKLPKTVTARLTLYRELPFADVEITLHDKPFESWPEAGWLCLPFKVNEPRFHLGRLASIIDPASDVIPGANRHIFGLNTGLTMTDARGRGVGICPLDAPLVSLDTPGCWKYSLDFVPKKPIAYLNLFNNQWTTNFRLWNQGTWTYRVRLWAIDRYEPESALISPALEARFALQAAIADGAPGSLPPSRQGLELSRKGILVTAFGPNPDDQGTVLRLWECAGKSGSCRVTLPAGVQAGSVQPLSLRGEPLGQPIRVHDGMFKFELNRYSPASFRLADAGRTTVGQAPRFHPAKAASAAP